MPKVSFTVLQYISVHIMIEMRDRHYVMLNTKAESKVLPYRPELVVLLAACTYSHKRNTASK